MTGQEFSGKIVVVTGGTRGIGRAIADAFTASGATVVTLARHDATITADMTDEASIAAAFTKIGDDHGRVDILVNNAGGTRPGPAATYSPAKARKTFDLNVLGPLYASQRAFELMPVDGFQGSIVNIGSVSSTRGSPGTALYGAAKAALSALTKSLALEWAPRVRVNCIVSGPVLTESAIAYYGGEAAASLVGAGLPLGRMAEPADIADACLYLASPRASYISGADLLVHGGGETPFFNRNREATGPAHAPSAGHQREAGGRDAITHE